jgi:hypothetical protein
MSNQDSPRAADPAPSAGPGADDAGLARRRDRIIALAFSAGANFAIFAALFWAHVGRQPAHVEPDRPPLMVSLLQQPQPKPPGPPDMADAEAAPPALQPPLARLPVITITRTSLPDNSDVMSESDLAGAASAGEGGGGGGGCDTARAVQQALRRDPLVRAAVEDANRLGKAIKLWDGDWVRSGEQDGKGLSAVREAIVWEVAFSPESCRNQRMHGLVLLTLADGNTRFAIGSGDWRWSDLLAVRKEASIR